jgi:HSP20 family molecular chaperone IbpA
MLYNRPITNDTLTYFNAYHYYAGADPYKTQDLDRYIELPGVDKKNCQVSFEDEYIIIEAKDIQRDKERKFNLYVGDIDVSTLNAELKDGLLHLTAKQKNNKKQIELK